MDIFPMNYGSGLSTFIAIVLIFDKIIFPLWRNWRADRKITLKTQKIVVPNNPNGKPGKAKECMEHMKKLTEVDTEIKNIKSDIEEIKKNNREDHKEIFKEINKLRR